MIDGKKNRVSERQAQVTKPETCSRGPAAGFTGFVRSRSDSDPSRKGGFVPFDQRHSRMNVNAKQTRPGQTPRELGQI